MSAGRKSSRRKFALKVAAIVLGLVALWIIYDLYAPRLRVELSH